MKKTPLPARLLFTPFLIASLLSAQLLFSQPLATQPLPIIRATSKNVSINDGGFLDKDSWTLSPAARPDVYTADRSRKTKWVTFYTDIDSIRVKVKPGTRFDFIILLNGRDSCYTRIASAISPNESGQTGVIETHDTIPFTLTAFNAIQVQAIINGMDTINLHFDVGSFDFRLTRDAILKRTHLLSNQPEAMAGKVTPNYGRLDKVNTLQMGSMVWGNPEIRTTTLTAREMDGRFGWNLFEGKGVELDYDHNLLIIHSKLPRHLKGYTRSRIDFLRSYVCIKGAFKIEDKLFTGNFMLDTGSDQAVILDSAWSGRQGFAEQLKLIRSSVLKDPRGNKYETRIVLSPAFRLEGFDLTNIPTMVLGGQNPTGFEINFLGNDLLKRFNIILDFKNDYLYLKPNKLMGAQYKENS